MISFYSNTDMTSTWTDDNGTGGTITIKIDPCSATYSSNLPAAYFEPAVPDEEALKQELKAIQREESILALLDLRDEHNRVRPVRREGGAPTMRCRRPELETVAYVTLMTVNGLPGPPSLRTSSLASFSVLN